MHKVFLILYLLFIWGENDGERDLHPGGHLATGRLLTSYGKVRRLVTSHFDISCHLVQVPKLQWELVHLVRLKLLKCDFRGERLKQSLVNIHAGLFSKGGCPNVQKLDNFWWVHLLRGS